MIQCQLCGRWVPTTEWNAHTDNHDLQQLLDHTGPHGQCNREQIAPQCKCPDPVMAAGHYVCTCCEGAVATIAAMDS